MPQPSPSPEDGITTDPNSPRGKLLEQAACLFREKGYERTTVRDIAAAVGIQSGSIFHHFSSKEDILRAVMGEALTYFTAELRTAIDDQSSVRDRLLACIRSELQFTVGDETTAIMSLLITEWRSLGPDNQADILAYRSVYEQLWMDVLSQARTEGLIEGDVFVLRRLLAGAIHWTMNWFQLDGELSLEALAEQTLNLACTGRAGKGRAKK